MYAIPRQPNQDLLIEALRVPAPRRVQYVSWVRLTRLLMLNGWVLGFFLTQWMASPDRTHEAAAAAVLCGAAFLLAERSFRRRYYFLSQGEATVGVVLSREVIKTPSQKIYQIHYCYWTKDDEVGEKTITLSKFLFYEYPENKPITILYDPKAHARSHPLFWLQEIVTCENT
jgi:hypothetical protein